MPAQYIRTGQLVPVLPETIADIHGLFLYYGSRVAQPLRVRRFIDLAIERLANRQDVVLSAEEISLAHIQGKPVTHSYPAVFGGITNQ
ncbi:hypothetical protein [Salmonella bongori]|uniref:hypothetical protein n=1 Tax=Salmonella bongori TaxID=54736 RepID=UPI0015C42825|nr:hypothetical protein [Salmonella bongori]